MFQRREQAKIDTIASPASQAIVSGTIQPDGLIGRMEILRLGVSVTVIEGAGEATLRRAAGHIEGTALPGQPGNVGIAGHRDSFFRPLKNIQRDDVITLTTSRGQFRYRVVSTRVVSPSDIAVLNPDGTEVLTLVTCYPFYFIGAAPSRFVVRAARVI
jgi:sortase A